MSTVYTEKLKPHKRFEFLEEWAIEEFFDMAFQYTY